MPSKEEKKKLRRSGFIDEIMQNNTTCFRYTGFPNTAVLKETYEWLRPVAKNVKLWGGKGKLIPGKAKRRARTAMSLFEEFIMTLVRIRRGYDTHHLAYLFGVGQSHVSRIVITWINLMYRCFLQLLKWPSKDVVKGNVPSTFALYTGTKVLIDATEFHVDK